MKIIIFRGDLTDISAKTEAVVSWSSDTKYIMQERMTDLSWLWYF